MWETAPLMQGAIRMHVRHEASTQAVIGLLGGNSRMQNNLKATQPLSRATMFRRKQFNGRREVETNLVGRETCRSHWTRRDLSQTQHLAHECDKMKGKTKQAQGGLRKDVRVGQSVPVVRQVPS